MLDIHQIREELNELPFKDGKREVFVGRISEMFEQDSDQAIAAQLGRIERELQSHALKAARHDDDRDALFVVQELRTLPVDLSWMAEAMQWVSKITTVAVEMILPGLAGWWLDNQLGTRFLVLLGIALGVPLGLWHLIAMTRSKRDDVEG